ncbi:hypothetical protein ABENE_11730 [Asticcacaulis benevestitus DSM 16100 = ATCC BAA-896]|uniref:Uncharacterized protein n=2 Tax=Asticcacaulis TaxID=76890 RepID=V4PYK1_9CAUL|nr:hypothetical protein ABENE_11730 [Asticcacaulis benevestitus DSM 16100 = ATCC BAA-896]
MKGAVIMSVIVTRLRHRISDGLELSLAILAARTSRRTRLTGAVVVALGLHALFLWALLSSRLGVWDTDLAVIDEAPVLIELWDVPPLPKPEPVPVIEPVVTPREVEPQDTPQQVDETPQKSESAPAVVAPQPVVQPQVVKPITIQIPKEKPLDMTAPKTVADVPARPNIGATVKKKTQEEIEAAKKDTATQVTDLNLHAVDSINMPALQKVQPSGLAPTGQAAAPEGGRIGTVQLPLGSINGTGLKGGRGQVTQSLQNHDWCVATQKAGEPIPADCKMTDLASQPPLGPRPDKDFQAAVAKKDFDLRYKTTPGNDEYWKRVNHAPTSSDRKDDLPKKGAYSNPKDQRLNGN